MKLKGMPAVLAGVLVLCALQAACIAIQAFQLSSAVCQLWEGRGIEQALPHIGVFAACFALLQLVRFAQETMLDRYSLNASEALRNELVEHTFDNRRMLASRFGSARIAAAANDGIDEVQTYIRIIPPKMIGMAVITVPLLICEFALDWASGTILAVMFPVIIFFMVLLGRQARARSERQYARYTRLTNRFMDTLRGLPVIRAFGASEREAQDAYESSEDLRKATVRTLRTATLSSAVLDLCATFGTGAVAIMLAFRLMDGSLDLFTALTALILAPEYFNPIRAFASDYHASLDGKNALADVFSMLDEPNDIEAGSEGLPAHAEPASKERDAGADARTQPRSAQAIERADREMRASMHEVNGSHLKTVRVTFDDVSYVYEDGTVGLSGATFEATSGEKIGIIGKSGAGKTTLANLIAGFTSPTGGSISLSDTPAGESDPSWRSWVRYIPQHPHIFRATLEDNIRFYNPDSPRGDVIAAASAVGLGDLLSELEDGLDTLVGEGWRGLSGGEAHRVALARILLDNDARVLVFDEPTAHLDLETERDLKEAMLKVMEGRLVFFATHRLHWMPDMDRILKLEAGSAELQEVAS